MKSYIVIGHIFAFVTVTIWSLAFVSNKALLAYISPIENMILRFLIAYILLLVLYPHLNTIKSIKDELHFALLGFLGIFVYFILENFALKFTQAANVGLYMGAIPIFTAIVAHFLTKDEELNKFVWLGFLVSLIGMSLILFDSSKFELRLKGDILALLGALTFAIYSVAVKLAPKGYHYIVITRKSFLYGLIFMLLYYIFLHKSFNFKALSQSVVILNILYLGVISSGLAFILWQQGIEKIGSIKASNYIYLVPLITAIAGVILLNETMSHKMAIGAILIIAGLYVAQKR